MAEGEDYSRVEDFSFGGGRALDEEDGEKDGGGPDGLTKLGSSSTAELHPKVKGGASDGKPSQMPPASVMTRLILIMVWRKLIRNPNTYSSLIGLVWSLVAYRSVRCQIAASVRFWNSKYTDDLKWCFMQNNLFVMWGQVARGHAADRSEVYLHPVGRGTWNGHVQFRWVPLLSIPFPKSPNSNG